MKVGALGDIVFQVSDDVIKTINNVQWSGAATYATHARHNTNSLTEFTGIEPDSISFDIYLSAYLGVNPMEDITRLWNYERNGTAVSLTIGSRAYGKHRWNVVSHSINFENYDGRGDMLSATVSVSLQEYLKE